VDVWTAVGGTFVATITIQDSDILSNTVWLNTGIATGTITAGMKLLISGSSGQANSGMFGLRYYQVGTNTGNWMGVQRSAWPGKYNTPSVAVNGALTPQIVRALQTQMEFSKGMENDGEELVAHATPSELAAWGTKCTSGAAYRHGPAQGR